MCPVEEYARAIDAGQIDACKWVKLACRRHLDDLETQDERGLYWDGDDAALNISFFEKRLCHSKGKLRGRPFILEPWEKFIIGSIYGWKRKATGLRRFREAWVEIPRKNGKTQIAAGVGLQQTDFDAEGAAEVYSAATKRAQAKLSFDEAKRMVKRSPDLKKRIQIYRDSLAVDSTDSKFEPLGADADTADGLNPSCLILDEVHAWKGREFWDVLDTSMGSRDQPLKFCITTAAVDSRQETVYDEQHKYAKNVLEGRFPDDSLFAIIYTIDEGDDWQDEKNWAKANPNLGVSVSLDYLRDRHRKAKNSPTSINAFKRLYLNVRTASVAGWLPMDLWDRCGLAGWDVAELLGKDCFGGLDIANSSDLAAFVLVFPWQDGYRVLWWFWCPDEARDTRGQKLRDILAPWIDDELIEATEGNEIDFKRIEERIRECNSMYSVKEIAFDPWNAKQLAQNLAAEGLTMFEFTQNMRNFNEPSKLLESLIRQGKFWHGANAVATWMAGNVTVRTDGIGNQMPDRKKSANKIDGIPAAIMGLARAALAPAESTGGFEAW